MTMLASQITSLTVVYSIVYSGVNQRKHQSSASLAFVREIHRGPVNFPHKGPVTRKMFPFDDVIMDHENNSHCVTSSCISYIDAHQGDIICYACISRSYMATGTHFTNVYNIIHQICCTKELLWHEKNHDRASSQYCAPLQRCPRDICKSAIWFHHQNKNLR